MGAKLTRTRKTDPATTTAKSAATKKETTDVDKVPNELLLHVFSLLERFSQIRFRRVCSRWDELLRSYQPAIVKVDVEVTKRMSTIRHGALDGGFCEATDMTRYDRLINHQDRLVPLGVQYVAFVSEGNNDNGKVRHKQPSELIFAWSAENFVQCHGIFAKSLQRSQLVGIIYDNVDLGMTSSTWSHREPVYRSGMRIVLRNAAIWYPAGCEGGRMCKSRYQIPVVCEKLDLVLLNPNGLLDLLTRTAWEHFNRLLVEEQWKKAVKYWTSVSTADLRKLRKIL